jgi:hypothetical protein
MVVFVKSAPSNCKVVLATSRKSRLHQVKSHNPNTTSQLVFICEDGVSFEHTHHTQHCSAQVLEENLLQLGVTSKRVFGLFAGERLFCLRNNHRSRRISNPAHSEELCTPGLITLICLYLLWHYCNLMNIQVAF